MGKRSDLTTEKPPKDYWPTLDPAVMVPEFIKEVRGKRYAEPCAGEGHLVDHLMDCSTCVWESDIRDTCGPGIDALTLTKGDLHHATVIITNPPFSWPLLNPLLDYLPTILPSWFLLPADMMHNKRMGPYMKNCAKVISVGRLYWMDNKVKGVDNFAWYRFLPYDVGCTEFVGR